MLDPSWLRLLLGVAMLMFVAHKLCEDEEEDREHAEINEDALELQELHTLTEARVRRSSILDTCRLRAWTLLRGARTVTLG